MAAKKKPDSFESKLDALEALVERLEDGDLPLEQSLKEFEQGIKLARECQGALKDAEQKVQILMQKHADARPEDYGAAGEPAGNDNGEAQ
jgi:exodeoxyribonuclease VII small subunit